MAAITGKGPSARHEIFYLGESTVGAVRIDDYKFRFIDQPAGWLGEKTHPDVPYITNLRLDPFERTGWPNNGTKEGAQQYFDWFKYQFWRFVFVQQQWPRKSRPSSITRRCSGARASTLTLSKRRWRKGWPRQRRRAKALVNNCNGPTRRAAKARRPSFHVRHFWSDQPLGSTTLACLWSQMGQTTAAPHRC